MSPDLPQFHYLRALILCDANRHDEAIDAYNSTIGLSADLNSLNGEVFRGSSLSYATLGKYCEAITPIQSWVSINPAENNTPAHTSDPHRGIRPRRVNATLPMRRAATGM